MAAEDAGGGVSVAGEDFYPELDAPVDREPPAEPEPVEPEEPEEEVPPDEGAEPPQPMAGRLPARPGRRERQTAELRNLREENERLRRDFEAFRTSQQRPGPDPAAVARAEQQEREYVQNLMPEQQTAYWRDKDRREFQQELARTRLEVATQIDKTAWDNAARVDPIRARFSAEVERLWQDELRAGRTPPGREILFTYVYGLAALQARSNSSGQRQQAARRVAAQQTRPGGVRSDGTRQAPRPAADSYEAALERTRGRPLW